MSDDIPSSSNSAPKSIGNISNQHVKRNRRKHGKFKLPTPPPDPREEKKESCTENEFLEYLENLHKHTANYSRSTSTLASALVTEDAFDHLERLYKLMEQMLELRAQNAKLHRKIRDLEHINNLEKMYREVDNLGEDEPCSDLDKDTAFAETILESILYEPKQYLKSKGSLRHSLIGKHRNRSSSAIDKPIGLDTVESTEQRRASLSLSSPKKTSKVSKWTKVKAAFKWEKASTTVGDAKSLDSGISGIAPAEVITYLRVPSNEDAGHSPTDSGAAEISTPGSLSSASSNENFHKAGPRCRYEEPRSSDDERSHIYSSHSKEDANISPPSSQRSHRTPWARMKDIMNTRNPVRRKKLSSHSDDIQIDIELCSDNEEVFESTPKSNSFSNFTEVTGGKLESDNEIPLEIRQRYKSNDETYEDHNQLEDRKISKWTKVKNAFLPASESNMVNSELRDNGERYSKEDIQSEINRNYRHLQKKLSIEFQDKLSEWKKIKHNNPSVTNPAPSSSNTEEATPPNTAFMKKMEEWEKFKSHPMKPKGNIQMTKEENLPPDFKKKLHEWEKMKKLSVRKCPKRLVDDTSRGKLMQISKTHETCQIEIPVISEEFKKKLEEWKQIKASGYKSDDTEKKNMGNKTPSPKLLRMDSNAMKQNSDLQWYEKELNKIEKEKGRLERERQKFMETEEKLSKLRKSVAGGNKKDILVHTPSGFYKFEGISRKFTQKLYEWEKSRGIGPESSTFAFLTPSYPNPTIPKVKINGEDQTPPLTRSRSVDSIVASTMNVECPLKSQPSSLSLNDVDELQSTCLNDSKTSSTDYIPCCEMEAEEPEALIVEVEDFVEETAAPLKSFIEQHNAVYQCERVRALCEGETCLAPKIRRSESARAQTNYNLIEDILTALTHLADNDVQIRKDYMTQPEEQSPDMKQVHERQKHSVTKLLDKLQRLQEANAMVVLNITKENENAPSNHIIDILEIVQDLSVEIVALSEKLDEQVEKNRDEYLYCRLFDELSTQEIIAEIRSKLLELRRHLSYVCAASDSTAPLRRGLCRMKSILCEKSSNESRSTISDLSQTSGHSKTVGMYVKNGTKNQQCQGAVKKRIRYRVENIRRKSLEDSDEEEIQIDTDLKKCPKFLRTRTLSDASTRSSEQGEDIRNRNNNIFPVVSKSTFIESPTIINPTDSPVTIFVKTTRKLFTPFIERSLNEQELQKRELEQKSDITSPANIEIDNKDEINIGDDNQDFLHVQNIGTSGLPPLPSSPIPQKKYLKDISPSIRLMLNKYHQKMSERDCTNKSGGSSGSASPVAWRSPTAERRVRAQMIKYQEEISRPTPFPNSHEVYKSASQSAIGRKMISPEIVNSSTKSSFTEGNILKSTSAANLKYTNSEVNYLPTRPASEKLRTNIQSKMSDSNSSAYQMNEIWSERCSERLRKLKKAKEEFFNSGPSSAPPLDINSEQVLQYPKRNRLSQISVESSSSTGSITPGVLMKSISAGMINIAAEAYKQFEGEKPREYVSLPRNTRPDRGRRSALTNLAAKFRKVKMRRGKEREKDTFPAVSELCRQTLVVDINQSGNQEACNSSSSPHINRNSQIQSEPIPKSNSWICKTNLFKN